MLCPIVEGGMHLHLLVFMPIDVYTWFYWCSVYCAEFLSGSIKRANHIVFFYTMCTRGRFILYDFVALGRVKDLGEGFDGKKK